MKNSLKHIVMILLFRFVHLLNLKFIYSKKAAKFCKISILDLTVWSTVKSKVQILQIFVAF